MIRNNSSKDQCGLFSGVASLLTVILHEYHFNDKDTETEVRTGKLQLYVVKTIDTN